MAEQDAVEPKNPRMYEGDREFLLPATPSLMPNNLTVMYFESKFTTYACYFSKNMVQLMSWDLDMKDVTMESLPLKESETDKPLSVMQCRLVAPANRSLPILVVATISNVMLFDTKNLKILASSTLLETAEGAEDEQKNLPYIFARGITYVENFVVVGTSTGNLILFTCTGETSFTIRTVSEHTTAIVDLATCIYDFLTLSADICGSVFVWERDMKKVKKRISTNQQISVINILRKQAFCGTYNGQILVYSVVTGAQLAEVNMHSRQITSIDVAPESAYILTASEDGYVRLWKLHSRKPENYQIEYRYVQKCDDIVVGGQFVNDRGSGFAIAQFEYNKLSIFMIRRSTAPAK